MTAVEPERAHAKINLYLHITGRRSDGFHLLDSLFVFAEAHDTVEGCLARSLTLEVAGPGADALAVQEDNLVLRAAETLRSATGVRTGAALRLHKTLPVAAGIGGGSADAAATLRLLNRLWGTELSTMDLCKLGERLGADVPACVLSQPVRVAGVGETLAPLSAVPPLHFVLVNPGVPLSTVAVFKQWAEGGAAFSDAVGTPRLSSSAAFIGDLMGCHNDLEGAAQALVPELAGVLSALRAAPGCRLARMSGSGGTCFGLFGTARAADDAAQSLGSEPRWWIWSGGLAQEAKIGSAVL